MTTEDTGLKAGEAEPTPSYEEAREELVEVVRALEGGGTSLAESLALWERGEHLARVCQEALDGARARLDAVIGQDDEQESRSGGRSGGQSPA